MRSRGAYHPALTCSAGVLLLCGVTVAQPLPSQTHLVAASDNPNDSFCAARWDRVGKFSCDGNDLQHQTICGCRPPGFDTPSLWVNAGVLNDKECYSHLTGVSCENRDFSPEGIVACSSEWQTTGSFTCDSGGIEHQSICGCLPTGAENPALWTKEGGGCYSHTTGRTCSSRGGTLRGIWDPAQKDGTWRTDLNDPAAGTIRQPLTLLPCTFEIGDPYLIYAGPTYWRASTGEVTCDLSSTVYQSSNASTSSDKWPVDNFWVVHANNEFAFGSDDSCSDGGANTGPPGQSKRVSAPGNGMFGFEFANSNVPLRKKGVLALDTNAFPNCVGPVDKGKIPFISFGLQTNRGAGALPITYLNDPSYPDVLRFSATIEDIAPDGVTSSLGLSRANFGYVFFEANWNAKRRWVFVTLLARYPAASYFRHYSVSHWNWNVAESMWNGGAEIVFISAEELKGLCPKGALSAALLAPTIGSSQSYAIGISEIFRCISRSERASWSDPFPDTPIGLTGIHWAIEMTFGKNWEKMSIQTIDLAY